MKAKRKLTPRNGTAKVRATTMPGFAAVANAPTTPVLPDPVCAKSCGSCWACRRAAGGPLYYLGADGEPWPTPESAKGTRR